MNLKTLYYLIIFMLPGLLAYGQQPCGTEISPEQQEYLINSRELRNSFERPHLKKLNEIPVQIYVFRASDSTGGMDTMAIINELDSVNDIYSQAGLHFFRCGGIIYINDDRYVNFNRNMEVEIEDSFYQPGVLNIYFSPKLYSGSYRICGYSKFPPSADRIFMSNECATNGSTLAHEIGHYFSLYHTHHTYGTGFEFVDGSNCETAGDELCGTPADPNIHKKVNGDCIYTMGETDYNGDAYEPQVENLMSYAPKKCRYLFTQDQMDRISYSFYNDRFYLGCCARPVARIGLYTNDHYPGKIWFYDSSYLAKGTKWYLSTGDSSDRNIYNFEFEEGTYNIKLIVENECGTDTAELEFTINSETGINGPIAYRDHLEVFPNPFKERMNLKLGLSNAADVRVTLFSVLGLEILQYERQDLSAGTHQLVLDDIVATTSAEFYILRVQVNDHVYLRKVVHTAH